MYARLAIASDALDTGLPLAVANVLHRAFVEEVQAHGRLVFGGDPEVSALLRAITSGPGLPPNARAQWRETLLLLRQNKRITVLNHPEAIPLAEITNLADLRKQWGS